MSNIFNNRINTIMTPTQVTSVKNGLQAAVNNMPFLIGLTHEERKTVTPIDVSNKVFTEDAIDAAINNPTMVPPFISMTNVQNDITLFDQLDELEGIASQLLQRITDTRMLAGSEAYQAALSLYKSFGNFADAGAPGAEAIVNKLKKRFNTTGSTVKNVPGAQSPDTNL